MKQKKYKYFTNVQLYCGIACIIALAIGLTYFVTNYVNSKHSSEIPAAIEKHIAFQVFAPSVPGDTWTVPEDLIRYNTSQGLLSITTVSNSNQIVLSEEPTPQIFANIPQYYPTLISGLNSYDQLQIGLGTIYLTHPKELHGGQTAVMNTSGTLVFARPLHDLSNSQWESFFNNLVVIK